MSLALTACLLNFAAAFGFFLAPRSLTELSAALPVPQNPPEGRRRRRRCSWRRKRLGFDLNHLFIFFFFFFRPSLCIISQQPLHSQMCIVSDGPAGLGSGLLTVLVFSSKLLKSCFFFYSFISYHVTALHLLLGTLKKIKTKTRSHISR